MSAMRMAVTNTRSHRRWKIQHACQVFQRIPNVFELQGTKRFVPGDPLIEFLQCMRGGQPFPDHVWRAFEATFASDNHGVLDARHCAENFRNGYGMAIYWETLARWIATRVRRDARVLQAPLVFLQSADECNTLDREVVARLLTVANIHHTGHMHGVLLAHVGMRVRLTAKFNATLGLVQEQKATIVDFLFHDVDAEAYRAARPGCVFRPNVAGRHCAEG